MSSHASALARLRSIDMPGRYHAYYDELTRRAGAEFEVAAAAKSTLCDASSNVEPRIAYDLADRVARMHDIEIATDLRDHLATHGKEVTALRLSEQIARGKYLPADADLVTRLDLAVRVGLAIVTEGVTVAPLQGIAEVSIRKNRDESEYLSVSIAGPMRSAGGTESAVTMLLADHVRKTVGLSKYVANSFGDDETGRFVEELRVYERDSGMGFQYHVLDEDIVTVVSNLPVELDGVETDPVEVVNHKGMKRIKTDRVRGGALRVLNDGLIGRSKKLLKRIDLYNLDGWEWLAGLRGAVQTGDDKEDAAAKRMREVIIGRSVLSTSGRLGGFRLRYGRACNTGFAAIGFHPAVAEILNHTIVVGTQVKIDMPGKGATVAFVDSIEPPTVMLDGGDVVRVSDADHAAGLRGRIKEILHLGDVLVSFGDFLENNARLVPSGYVEEYWRAELAARIEAGGYEARSRLGRFLGEAPSLAESLQLARDEGVPLYPRYLHYWDQIAVDGLAALLEGVRGRGAGELRLDAATCKPVLERLGVPHRAEGDEAVLAGDEAVLFEALLYRKRPDTGAAAPPPPGGAAGGAPAAPSVPEMISASSGIEIRPKFSTALGVRIGRPEKAAARSMTPPVHTLFPVSAKGGAQRDLLKAAAEPDFFTHISNRACAGCGEMSLGIRCAGCGEKTAVARACGQCRAAVDGDECGRCKRKVVAYAYRSVPIKKLLMAAQEKARVRAQVPLKGVNELIGQDRAAEPLEKGLLRQSRGLTVFKDGTVRFEATNSPLTHFRPAWIGTGVDRLRELGYEHDIDGLPLERDDQTVELMMQDVIIPEDGAAHLVRACKYVDDELERFYGRPRYYNASNADSLVGQLVVGLAPHTSVGVVARIIGRTGTHVCFGTPNWHSAKRRDADGDADSVMLLMDVLLNFSRQFLSDRIGGLMDAPLLIQPLVLPHESQPQAHNLEVMRAFPAKFFEATLGSPKASDVDCVEIIRSRLDSPEQFRNYHYTHPTGALTKSNLRSAYSTAGSMVDKLDMQIRTADLIRAVDTSVIVTNVLTAHLVPDMMGNLRSYAQQKMRCTACNASYRRPPLRGKCKCGHELIQTITRASVEKYLSMAKRLVEKYDISRYHHGRVHALADEIDLVFGKGTGDQALLTDFAA